MPRDIVDNRDVKHVLKEIRREATLIDDEGVKAYKHRADHVTRLLEWLEMRFPTPAFYSGFAMQVIKYMRRFS